MRYILCFLIFISSLSAITLEEAAKHTDDSNSGYLLFNALNKSGSNEQEMIKAIESAPDLQKKAVIFLISFMPERDLRDLKADYILENVKLAYEAREKYPWAKKVPVAVFLNDVLPYATLNERRDNWRKDFYERFAEVIKGCKSAEEATIAINKNIKENLGVIYSTKRPKADQSPYESMECKLASCTGLSILLTNALRSVGIPSRIAGVPKWTNKNGNHNWNEVWIDGKWYFTEYYYAGLNKGWFLKDAAAANSKKWDTKVYATSFTPTEYWYPCVWDFNIRYVHGLDVSERYKELYRKETEEKSKGFTVRLSLLKGTQDVRVATKVSILNKQGKEVISGVTKGEEDDLNNVWEFRLPKGVYKAVLPDGKQKEFEVKNVKTNVVNLKID